MLAKKYRLPIQEVYTKNQPTQSFVNKPSIQAVRKNSFFIIKTKQSDLPLSRFGVVVGSKVEKLATGRNLIRRNIYRWILSVKLHQKPGKDVMIIVLPKTKKLIKSELEKELRAIFF